MKCALLATVVSSMLRISAGQAAEIYNMVTGSSIKVKTIASPTPNGDGYALSVGDRGEV